jgi:hypothetical protein
MSSVAPPTRASQKPPAGSSTPPAAGDDASPHDHAAKLTREQKELLSEFTRELVQSVNKTAYYGADHPAHYEVGAPLHEMLVAFLADNAQVAYLLNRSTPPEIFVDGLASGRVRMSDIMPAGVYTIFVPRFVEYFDRHDLVLLAFRKGVTLDEFVGLVSTLSRPMTPGQEFDISEALLERKVFNISVLVANDVAARDIDLPWQIRMCLARLRRDLRLMPMFRDLGHQALVQAKRQIFQDIVRPINNAELLKQLVVHAARIQEDIAHVEGLEDIQITPLIIESLGSKPVIELARKLCEAMASAEAELDGEALRVAIGLCAERLTHEHVPDAEPVLRLLYEHQILKLEDLPVDLQDWIRAEAIVLQKVDGKLPEIPLDSSRDFGVLAKVGRLGFVHGRFDETAQAAERLTTAAMRGNGGALSALHKMVSPKEVEALIARYSAEKDDGIARLFVAMGEPAAIALACHIALSGANAQMDRVAHLLDRMNVPGALVSALRVPNLDPAALRVLLTLAARRPDPSLADVAAPHVDHVDAGVRLAALMAMQAAESPQAIGLLVRALDDPDPAVVTMALAALPSRHGRPDLAHGRALALAGEREKAAEIRVAAIQSLGAFPGAGEDRARTIAALELVAKGDGTEKGFLGLTRRIPPKPEIAEAVRAALGAIGARVEGGAPEKKGFFDRFRR